MYLFLCCKGIRLLSVTVALKNCKQACELIALAATPFLMIKIDKSSKVYFHINIFNQNNSMKIKTDSRELLTFSGVWSASENVSKIVNLKKKKRIREEKTL